MKIVERWDFIPKEGKPPLFSIADMVKRKEEEKKENLEFINKQISELEEVRNAILRGEDVDIEDYEFSYEVEDAIRESALEEYREGEYEPRGRR